MGVTKMETNRLHEYRMELAALFEQGVRDRTVPEIPSFTARDSVAFQAYIGAQNILLHSRLLRYGLERTSKDLPQEVEGQRNLSGFIRLTRSRITSLELAMAGMEELATSTLHENSYAALMEGYNLSLSSILRGLARDSRAQISDQTRTTIIEETRGVLVLPIEIERVSENVERLSHIERTYLAPAYPVYTAGRGGLKSL